MNSFETVLFLNEGKHQFLLTATFKCICERMGKENSVDMTADIQGLIKLNLWK